MKYSEEERPNSAIPLEANAVSSDPTRGRIAGLGYRCGVGSQGQLTALSSRTH